MGFFLGGGEGGWMTCTLLTVENYFYISFSEEEFPKFLHKKPCMKYCILESVMEFTLSSCRATARCVGLNC